MRASMTVGIKLQHSRINLFNQFVCYCNQNDTYRNWIKRREKVKFQRGLKSAEHMLQVIVG